MYRIGFDVGGTFTDLTVLNEETGALRHVKVPSSHEDPSEAIQTGIERVVDALGIDPGAIGFLGHGTTIATNMVIERRGSPTAVLTTAGFRDILEIGRQQRPQVYDYTQGKPPPLVPREHRYGVRERIDAAGQVLVPLDEESLAATVAALQRDGIEAVAVCYLHSYLNRAHEMRTRDAVARHLPGVFLSISCDVLPEFREYERLSTTVMNAYIGPRMARYLDTLVGRLRNLGISVAPHTIHSNGGVMSLDTVRRFPVRTCLSGPAAGVIGAAQAATQAGHPHIVTFDVGGTSTDVSLVRDSTPRFTTRRLVAGFPVTVPMLDIHVIGAGGGSIAAVDDAGTLKVGPRSAGAMPGPVAYGLGGVEPTLTDANLVLGRLGARAFLGAPWQWTVTPPPARSPSGSPTLSPSIPPPPRPASSASPSPTWHEPSAPFPPSAATTSPNSRSSRTAARARFMPPRWRASAGLPASSSRPRPAPCAPAASSCPTSAWTSSAAISAR